jgi:hypothetical protein
MPIGKYMCGICGAKCMRENSCYKHSQESKTKRKEALKTYKQTENFKEKRKKILQNKQKT